MNPEERVLILAPFGRDAVLASQVLAEADFSTTVCQDIDEVCQRMGDGAGLALVAEETLGRSEVAKLLAVVNKQPAWSDFPFVLLGVPEANGRQLPFVEVANVTILERPLRRRTLVAAVATALRARRKQYDARRAIQDRDEFLAMLGHELRNPLGAIRLATTLLAGNEREASGPRAIIERQTSRLALLVDDLLDVTRVTSGKIQLRLEPVDLQRILQQSAETVAAMAPAAQVTVHVRRAPEGIHVIGDAARLEQVFSNLLTNAIKYTPAGGRVDMEASVEGNEALVQVRDTGVGIPPEFLERIFDLFAQVETSLDRSRGGMGIGLTLVKELVELHGGTVTATSGGTDQGTAFFVRLPRSASPPETNQPWSGSPTGPRRHIVIVEDNDDIRASFRMVLSMAGHTVDEASDGRAGAEMIVKERPSAAFVDIGLPKMDGYEVARHVREHGSETILIALTGYGQPDDRQRAFDAGFDQHITKPVDIEDIERVLAHLPDAHA